MVSCFLKFLGSFPYHIFTWAFSFLFSIIPDLLKLNVTSNSVFSWGLLKSSPRRKGSRKSIFSEFTDNRLVQHPAPLLQFPNSQPLLKRAIPSPNFRYCSQIAKPCYPVRIYGPF